MVWSGQRQVSRHRQLIQYSMILALLALCGCQSGPASTKLQEKAEEIPVAPPLEPNQPRLTFISTVHDFGVVNPNSKSSCRFDFENTGTGPLTIEKKITSQCGCTVPSLPKNDLSTR